MSLLADSSWKRVLCVSVHTIGQCISVRIHLVRLPFRRHTLELPLCTRIPSSVPGRPGWEIRHSHTVDPPNMDTLGP